MSSVQRYVDFIGDTEFFREFLPNVRIRQPKARNEETFAFGQSPDFIRVELRDYQLEGLNWLIKMHEKRINCILADEMGLGKTLQSISLLGYIKLTKGEKAKHLVVVPKSCLQNWENEFKRFVPALKIYKFHASKAEISKEAQNVYNKEYDVILTTYEMCLYGKSLLRRVDWSYIVVDEAHRLKNENSQLSKMVREYNFKHRLLLTGTPLQNNVHELWALLNFIAPDVFYDSERFESYVLTADGESGIEKLRNVLRLFFLRREKMDVESSLSAKRYTNLYCPLSEMQREWYRSILQRDLSGLGHRSNISASLLNVVMQLKKVCNHPYLFEGAEPEPFETGEHIITNSGKMVVLDKLLTRLHQNGSRVLIFSQMSVMIDILEDYANYREYEYCRIDGRTSSAERTAAIEEFNKPGSTKTIFLLTTRAGGLGINLYTADTVVLFDSDWNPQADLQAQDRAHRIGQKKQVHVFRFITENTIEESIVLRAQQKLKLDDILIQKAQRKMSNALSQKELMEILSAGLDAVEGPKEQEMDSAFDIEDVLKRGEEKTLEMNAKLDTMKIGESFNSKDALYQWEGENYSTKRLEELMNSGQPVRTSRNSLFAGKKFRGLYFPDYQLYPKAFYDLQSKEEELFKNNQELSEEDKQRKKKLLEMGFNWTKKDYKQFLNAIEAYGDDLEKIKEAIPHKNDVAEYYKAFWERIDTLEDSNKIMGIVRRNKEKIERKNRINEILLHHKEGIEEHLVTKNRLYVDNAHLLQLYAKYLNHPQCFEMMKEEILLDERFIFDYFLQSRTPQDLARHISVLSSQLMKVFDRN